ncbi:hypothetical protein H312_03568 [Anncaliia algerae PRA339]|uniref:Uncharacterized protein n=1 Tax=Anncaliia algerae PRA339 TaxID=1288291 RepID=A0A059EWF6_9MICR|nr:hypothetical protein H312_03568 [Anncaliia algerae PRA339]
MKVFPFNIFYIKDGKPRTSKAGKKSDPEDVNVRNMHNKEQPKNLRKSKMRSVGSKSYTDEGTMLFKRGIEKKNILKEIFIIEGDEGFEDLSL